MPNRNVQYYYSKSVSELLMDPAARYIIGATGGGSITLTTTGTSGAATLVGTTLNIPNYTTGVTSVSNSDGTITVATGTTTPVVSLTLSHANTWTGLQTFNNDSGLITKQITSNNSFTGGIIGENTSGGVRWSIQHNESSGEIKHNAGGSYFPTFYSNNALALTLDTSQNTILAGGFSMSTAGKSFSITEGSNSRVGQISLTLGTKAVSITGLTTSSRAFVQLVTQAGTSTTVYEYIAACTSNTLTISAVTTTGSIVTTDTSTLNYFVIN